MQTMQSDTGRVVTKAEVTSFTGGDLRLGLNLLTKTLDWVLSESSRGLTLDILESEESVCPL